MNHCWAIDKILLTDQYKTRPAAKPAKTKVNTNGNKANILACVGSAGAGFNFCCNHIVKPIKIGKIPISIIDIGILPIFMGFTMWLQQKLNPAPPDPTQARIFALLPFVFTFVLAGFAAGLV